MRKLRTFYWKVTEFLNDDKITCLQRLGVNIRIGLYRRAGQTVYLYGCIGYLCKKVCQDVYSPCLMVWEENSRICLRNVVSVLTGDLSSTYVRVLQYFRESIGKMADTVAVKI